MLSADPHTLAAWRTRRDAIRASVAPERDAELAGIAQQIRHDVLDMITAAGQGHIGGDFSVADILTTLFHSVLDIDPGDPLRADRDIFILSKGHAAASFYAALASAGFFPREALSAFMAEGSALNGHPGKRKVPGVETSTGPLGHGLPVAVGAALGQRLNSRSARVFVVVGDGELQEGSNWEALMSAAHFGLANLCLVVDRNRLQQGARTEDTNALEPLSDKLRAFGWEVREADGHDFSELQSAFASSTTGRPVAIVARTVKGKGVSFIEDRAEWHHKVPSAEQVDRARGELQ